MRLHRVFLNNFGLFAGSNELDFSSSSERQDTDANITLIAGMNGAGKTTILEAVQLALYGRAALGKRVAQGAYYQHLENRIHRDKSTSDAQRSASVGLDFDHETMGSSHNYRIVRSWAVEADSLKEELEVLKDGERLADVDQQFWQDFVRELVPPGVSQLFFFDGEKIQSLADDEDSESVAEAIKSLLGLDLVERLQDDLQIYRERQLKKTGSKKALSEFEKAKDLVSGLEERLLDLRDKKATIVSDIQGHEAEVTAAEKSLTLSGGSFAKNREQLKIDKAVAQEKLEASEQGLREIAETAIPFAFCSDLASRLLKQLEEEEKSRANEAIKTWANDKLERLSQLSEEDGFGEPVLERLRIELLLGLPDSSEPIHGLSSDSEKRLHSWIEEANGSLAEKLRALTYDLEEATRGLQKSQEKLRQIPEEDALKARMDTLQDILKKRAESEAELKALDSQMKTLELELDAAKRDKRKASEKIEVHGEQADRIALLEKCRTALISYQHRLTLAKAKRLGEEVTSCFHHLHRKGDLVQRIEIDPVTCKVSLYDASSNKLSKKELSAGEKQMYAVAMLWGLALTSGRKLPLIIDTPLGRLDSTHRDNLVERYFPHAADQVIILSTDTEIDQDYYESLSPDVAQAYRLEFDPKLARTHIKQGYFWKEEQTCHA